MTLLSKEILNSNILHQPLPVHDEQSYETLELKKSNVGIEKIIFDQNHSVLWKHEGRGALIKDTSTAGFIADSRYDSWAKGAPKDGDYVNFGEAKIITEFNRSDWSEYNQISFEILASCKNMINPNVTVSFVNDGTIKIPDIYDREGYHVINLKGEDWHTYVLDLSNLPREAIMSMAIASGANGSYMNLPGKLSYQIRNIKLQKNNLISHAKGWKASSNELIYSHIGYQTTSEKKSILWSPKDQYADFQLIDVTTGKVVYDGKSILKKEIVGNYRIFDFTDFTNEGLFVLETAGLKTDPFTIMAFDKLYGDSIWRSLNFIYCERCGCPVSGIHGTCHEDVVATFENETITFNGGWHDAGDLSQQLIQSAELTLNIIEMSEQYRESDPMLSRRLLEEGEWGIDFILKTRLANGFHVTSAGITRWTDNHVGNMDDAQARIGNHAYDNFLLAGILAKIGNLLPDQHSLIEKITDVAQEDYEFAQTKFEISPYVHEPVFWEHTYNMSNSLFAATISWASSMLYQRTKIKKYADEATRFMDVMLDCQEVVGIDLFDGKKLQGMFYRDAGKKIFQHFNHQSRESMYAMALEGIIISQSKSKLVDDWKKSAVLLGSYYKYLKEFTQPYDMFPSGVYQMEEYQDQESFNRQHLLVGESAKEEYQIQLKNAVKIGQNLYIKRFPVWFSFRGNNAIILSAGRAAAILGNLLQDQGLTDMAAGQLQWMVGKNPFNQSMVYGEGHNFAQQYTVSSGEMVGEMPVGMQTFGNEDEPYWPQFNNATYKEVWVGNAGKWMGLLSDLLKTEKRASK